MLWKKLKCCCLHLLTSKKLRGSTLIWVVWGATLYLRNCALFLLKTSPSLSLPPQMLPPSPPSRSFPLSHFLFLSYYSSFLPFRPRDGGGGGGVVGSGSSSSSSETGLEHHINVTGRVVSIVTIQVESFLKYESNY